jgi:hypothetical protein
MANNERHQPTSRTYSELRYFDLAPNPLNPRRVFDKLKLDILEESIRANKILVPLTVYEDRRDGHLYILDGERRWRCAMRIERGEVSVEIPSTPNDLHIPAELKSFLVYDPSTRVLSHREPISESRRHELLALSSAKTWRSTVAKLCELSKHRPPMEVAVPVNVVDPPTPAANLLYMFHVHNLREQWELMPTALSLQILMKELREKDDKKLAELTNLSEPNVRRCKILLSYPKKYQMMMLDADPAQRLKAHFFIELYPVLDLYEQFGSRVTGNRNRDDLTDLFIDKYRNNLIPSVLHFRRILEARDELEDKGRLDEVKIAAARLVAEPKARIRTLFDPLTTEGKKVQNVSKLCKEFVEDLRKLKVEHVSGKPSLVSGLRSVLQEVQKLLDALGGED